MPRKSYADEILTPMKFLRGLLSGHAEPVFSAARPGDAAGIAELHAVSFHRGWHEDEVEQLLLDRNVVAQCAMTGNSLAGFIMSRIAGDEAEILSVAVAARRRSKGLAGALLKQHLGRLAGLGVRTIFLEVDENNEPARRLYRRAGFFEVGQRKGYYSHAAGSPSNALVLRRDLA